MVVIAPGVDYVARASFYAGTTLTAILLGLNYAGPRFGLLVSPWHAAAFLVVAFPAFAGAKVLSTKLLNARKASSVGARLAPEVQGKYPGNVDVLRTMIRNMEIGYPGDGLDELVTKHGTVFNMRVLFTDMLMTVSPDHIKTILATDFQNYVKGERFHFNMEAVLGTGVFNSDGDMWKFHRSITRPMFTRERISHFELFDRKAQFVVDKLRERLREGYPVDFQDLMSRFTLDSASEFLLGDSLESISAGLPYPHNAQHTPELKRTSKGDAANGFASAFLKAQEIISLRERLGWAWPLVEFWEDRAKGPMDVVNSYIEPIVYRALEMRRSGALDEKDRENETLLESLVRDTQDPRVLKDEILNIMLGELAGRDTTSATLTFIVYLLARHPDVMSRLREEVLSKVGTNRRPDYEDIKEMKYLRAVINETLRLFPIVPFNIRESVNDTTWKSENPSEKPIFIPAGTKTAYSVFMMQRRKDLWGPDAEDFDPDRFLDDRLKKYLSKNPFIFLPFNAGPRICLGQQFAYNEMSFMIIRLVQAFSTVELAPDAIPPFARPPAAWASAPGRKAQEQVFPKLHLTMYVHGGLWVRMKEAGDV